MIQEVNITSSGPAAIKPLLEAAIRSQLRVLEHGIERTRERLASFETRFEMTSAEFERGFETGQIAESIDFIEWAGEIKTLMMLEDQLNALRSAKVK